jgi:hypothetical protein
MGPDSISCDVLVVGGGPAGLAAAAAAGRVGAHVVLLEQYGFLGGAATVSHVGTVCGLYLRDTKGTQPMPVAGGFLQEFAARLQRASGLGAFRIEAGLWVLPYSVAAFAQVADDVVSESGNVTVALHATVSEAAAEGGRLIRVRALAWNKPLVVCPGMVVDCTGEATAAALAGGDVEEGAFEQAPALIFTLDQVDPKLADLGLIEVRRALRKAVEMGRLPALCERLALVPGTSADGCLTIKLNLTPADPARPVWQQITAKEREARALIPDLVRFLVECVASFSKARLSSIAPQLGVRCGRTLRGRARLEEEDVLSARKSSTGIARGCWPMERWGRHPRPELTLMDERDYYEIPLDCLRSADLDNVLAAGRCFSSAASAMSSARVIGTALATGWAAGTAAAFQFQGRPVEEAVGLIRGQMEEHRV